MNGKLLNSLKIGDYTLLDYTNSSVASKNLVDNSLPRELYDYAKLTLLMLTFINKYSGYYHTISSGYRCDQLNKLVGGVENSLHKSALAVDFVVPPSESNVLYLSLFKKYATAFVSTLYPDSSFDIDIQFVNCMTNRTMHIEIDFKEPIV